MEIMSKYEEPYLKYKNWHPDLQFEILYALLGHSEVEI